MTKKKNTPFLFFKSINIKARNTDGDAVVFTSRSGPGIFPRDHDTITSLLESLAREIPGVVSHRRERYQALHKTSAKKKMEFFQHRVEELEEDIAEAQKALESGDIQRLGILLYRVGYSNACANHSDEWLSLKNEKGRDGGPEASAESRRKTARNNKRKLRRFTINYMATTCDFKLKPAIKALEEDPELKEIAASYEDRTLKESILKGCAGRARRLIRMRSKFLYH